MKIATLMILAFLNFAHLSNAQNSSIEKEIDTVMEKLIEAYDDYDGAKIQSLIAEDPFVKVIHSGIIDRPVNYNSILPKSKDENKFTSAFNLTYKNIRIADDKSVVVLCMLHSTVTPEVGAPFHIKTINTIVLEKVKGKWLIVTMHSSPFKESRNF
jgi:hypothetical protein